MKLAIFFPGIGYHCDKPLLYYSRKMAEGLGYEAVTLSYSYDKNIRGNKEKMKEAFEALYKQAEERLESISFSDYDEILFVSKSVGTIVSSAYAFNKGITCKQILYTPVEYTFEYSHERACAFIGTEDPWSDVNKVVDMAKSGNVPITVYSKVNHSLEGKDTLENIELIQEVMKQSLEFMTES